MARQAMATPLISVKCGVSFVILYFPNNGGGNLQCLLLVYWYICWCVCAEDNVYAVGIFGTKSFWVVTI